MKNLDGLLDFHTHSTHSDGSLSPKELVREAKRKGVYSLALTDHNTISGLAEFREECKHQGIIGIPFGVEIYAELPKDILSESDNRAPDLVILGKNANPEPFYQYEKNLLNYFRKVFVIETVRKLESIGFRFPIQKVKDQCEVLKSKLESPPKIFHEFLSFPGNLENLIRILKKEGVNSEEVIGKEISYANRYLFAIGRPAYVDRISGFNISDALALSKSMNTKLFIAHPGGKFFGALRQEIIDFYINSGIDGIEVRNYFNSLEQNSRFDRTAKEKGLIRSGGSDYHGANGVSKIGMYDLFENQLPREMLEELMDKLPS